MKITFEPKAAEDITWWTKNNMRIIASLRNITSDKVQIDKANYRQMRLEYDALESMIQQMGIAHKDHRAIPEQLRRTISFIMNIRDLMIRRRVVLASAFNALDQQAPKTALLVPVDQDALWNRRAQANEYR